MIWPPQDTGLFAPPPCILCCSCVRSFLDNPFLTSLYTMTPRPLEAASGVVVTPTGMGTFTRFSCDIASFTFGFDRYYINDAFSHDPAACGEVFAGTMEMGVRITSRTGTIPINLDFYPMLLQGGNFYINALSTRAWHRTSISGSFSTSNIAWSASDPWNRFNPSDPTPDGGFNPDFTISGAPIQLGFRVAYGAFSFDGVTRNLTWDLEKFGALLKPSNAALCL